jgi:putative DNA methylase
MMDDRRLVEDFLPIEPISQEASREKKLRHGHISTLHLWWARRPLVACRAAVYASLVPADEHAPPNGVDPHRKSLARANASHFLKALCKFPGDQKIIAEAREKILRAHRRRTGEDGPPRVLDCFAGGGAIPLEALRLSCDAYALELNPVAYLILLGTVVYPQKYGRPEPSSGWQGLAREVEQWGDWVLQRVKEEVGDLYPPIRSGGSSSRTTQQDLYRRRSPDRKGRDELTPAAYLWTRTVPCKSLTCGALVPLVRQTWLCRKSGRYIALKVKPGPGGRPHFSRVKSAQKRKEDAVREFEFDPGEFSRGGNATCVFCGTVADDRYVREQGQAGRIGRQLMAVVCTRPGQKGKGYLAADEVPSELLPDDEVIRERIRQLCAETGLTELEEPLPRYSGNPEGEVREQITLGFRVQPYGLTRWSDLFTPRQLLTLLTFAKWVRRAHEEMLARGYDEEHARAVATMLGLWVDRVADRGSSLCRWDNTRETIEGTIDGQKLDMSWDFPESNPFGDASGNARNALRWVVGVAEQEAAAGSAATVTRGSATELPYPNSFFAAVVTDPPYYDNVPYSDLSDFFYVWLKRTVGYLHPEHFSTELAPKKSEIIADPYRHGGKENARQFYETMMGRSLAEIHRVLKPGGILTMVYAHKTVAGWETLIEALRTCGFVISQAWPLETEMSSRLRAMDSSALASSIFLVARKEEQAAVGDYCEAKRELEEIVRERVEALLSYGIGGADLLIACLGAGLRAYTRYRRVELPNGEEVPAGGFLREVEGIVQEVLLERLFKTRAAVAAVDAPTRFYVLWRYLYGRAELKAGDALVFAYPLGVELDGPHGLSTGRLGLLEKKGSKYRLRDFTERGGDGDLGLDGRFGMTQAPLVDVLHRLLWLVENRRVQAAEFVDRVMPNSEKLRLVAQVLAGSGLQGGLKLTTDAEHTVLNRLLGNWDTVFGGDLFSRKGSEG